MVFFLFLQRKKVDACRVLFCSVMTLSVLAQSEYNNIVKENHQVTHPLLVVVLHLEFVGKENDVKTLI
jgi:hypothetical protein